MWNFVAFAVSAYEEGVRRAEERERILASMTPDQRREFLYAERTAAINRLASAKEEENERKESTNTGIGAFIVGTVVGSNLK